jgi:two-component system LytT family response regulator
MIEVTPPKTRVVIADDEPLARERLRALLGTEAWIDLVAECHDGKSTISAIGKFRPDLVFLDVQMPGATGFDVIDEIGPDRMPFVVFVTAFDRYALKAFEVHALDYLLKPFDRDRFHDALTRARQQLDRIANGDLERRLLELVQDLKPATQPLERFVVKSGGRVFFVRAEEIEWIEAAGNYVKLHVGAESHLFR